MNLDNGGRLIASMKTAARRAVVAELSNPEPTRAGCMACGRSIDAEKARRGGRDRFCSTRCLDAFDAGWPVYGTTISHYGVRRQLDPTIANEAARRRTCEACGTRMPRKMRKGTKYCSATCRVAAFRAC